MVDVMKKMHVIAPKVCSYTSSLRSSSVIRGSLTDATKSEWECPQSQQQPVSLDIKVIRCTVVIFFPEAQSLDLAVMLLPTAGVKQYC